MITNKNVYNNKNDISNRLLDVIFEHIKIYDNEFIKHFFFYCFIIEIKQIFLYRILINIFQMRNIKF